MSRILVSTTISSSYCALTASMTLSLSAVSFLSESSRRNVGTFASDAIALVASASPTISKDMTPMRLPSRAQSSAHCIARVVLPMPVVSCKYGE